MIRCAVHLTTPATATFNLFRPIPPRRDHNIDITPKKVEQSQHLTHRLLGIRRIQKAVELARRGSKATNEFSLTQVAGLHGFLRFQRQAVKQEVVQITGILIVLEDGVEVDGVLAPLGKTIREALLAQVFIRKSFGDPILRRVLPR